MEDVAAGDTEAFAVLGCEHRNGLANENRPGAGRRGGIPASRVTESASNRGAEGAPGVQQWAT